jgi:hypothetical protein
MMAEDVVDSVPIPKKNSTVDAVSIPKNCSASVNPENCSTTVNPENCSASVNPENCSTTVNPKNCSASVNPENCSASVNPESCSTSVNDDDYIELCISVPIVLDYLIVCRRSKSTPPIIGNNNFKKSRFENGDIIPNIESQ